MRRFFGPDTSAAALSSGASDAPGKVYSDNIQPLPLSIQSVGAGLARSISYYPLRTDDILLCGGAVTATNGMRTIVQGPPHGTKVSSHVTGAYRQTLPHGRMCYDSANGYAFFIFDDGYRVQIPTDNPSTVAVESNTNVSGTVAAVFHDEMALAFLATTGETIHRATSGIATSWTACSMPDMTGVSLTTAKTIFLKTPTHLLVSTDDIRDPATGFLRSSDGVTFALIGGITDMVAAGEVRFAEYLNGRLYLCTSQGLWSTSDNGDTWRNDIPEGNDIKSVFQNPNSGLFIAVGYAGAWTSIDGENFTKTSTATIGYPATHSPDERLIYAPFGIFSEEGESLLSAANILESPYATDAYIGNLIPNGIGSVVVASAANSNTTTSGNLTKQGLHVHDTPEGGAVLDITAIGGGGVVNLTGTLYGKDTIVSQLLVAAGGLQGDGSAALAAEAGGNQGDLAMAEVIAATSSSTAGGTFILRGGKGLVLNGVEYGAGETLRTGASFTGSAPTAFQLSGVTATTRGGFSGHIARFVGFVKSPVVMRVGQSIFDSSQFGRSGPGAVLIKEVA
jgi:hypothetical protein